MLVFPGTAARVELDIIINRSTRRVVEPDSTLENRKKMELEQELPRERMGGRLPRDSDEGRPRNHYK